MKKGLSLVLSLALCFTLTTPALALMPASEEERIIPFKEYLAAAHSEFAMYAMLIFKVPRVSQLVMDQTAISNGTRAWFDYFDTTDEDPAYRVWIENTGDYSIQVYVKRGSADSSDNMAGPMVLAPGGQGYVELTTDNDGNSPGRRWVVINPIQGNSFEAAVRVRIAPSLSGLG